MSTNVLKIECQKVFLYKKVIFAMRKLLKISYMVSIEHAPRQVVVDGALMVEEV